MKQAAVRPTTPPRDTANPFALGVVVVDLLDTTWRIAVPVVLGAGVGIFVDRRLGTKPWLTLLLTVVGFVVAGVLVKRQLDAVARKEQEEPK